MTRTPPQIGVDLAGWAIAALVAIPLFSIYLIHFTAPNGAATGFVQYDQAYYVANGRAIFERGNGITYPNPYDSELDSPAVYFHLPIWLWGAAIHFLPFDPGWFYVAWGIVFGIGVSRLTLALVQHALGLGCHHPRLVFLFSMWGGGLFAAAAVIANAIRGESVFSNLMQFDPVDGLWFLNWGRNLVYSTEATYHVFVAWCWLSVLNRRWHQMLIAGALAAASHPFTGAELLGVLLTWTVAGWALRADSRVPLFTALGLFVITAAFIAYYFLFLGLFGQHEEMVDRWQVPMMLDALPMLLAYGPVGLLAALRIWIDRRRLTDSVYFWIIAFVVAFLLANHEWFISPHQPLHFTHGYVWMPLFMIGAPVLDRILAWLLEPGNHRIGRIAIALVAGMLAVADNVGFAVQYARLRNETGVFLDRDEREILSLIDKRHIRGVLVCREPNLSYLAPVYAGIRTYYGHVANTPSHSQRKELVGLWFEGGTGDGPAFSDHDLILVRRRNSPEFLSGPAWRLILESEEFLLFERSVKTAISTRKAHVFRAAGTALATNASSCGCIHPANVRFSERVTMLCARYHQQDKSRKGEKQ